MKVTSGALVPCPCCRTYVYRTYTERMTCEDRCGTWSSWLGWTGRLQARSVGRGWRQDARSADRAGPGSALTAGGDFSLGVLPRSAGGHDDPRTPPPPPSPPPLPPPPPAAIAAGNGSDGARRRNGLRDTNRPVVSSTSFRI